MTGTQCHYIVMITLNGMCPCHDPLATKFYLFEYFRPVNYQIRHENSKIIGSQWDKMFEPPGEYYIINGWFNFHLLCIRFIFILLTSSLALD